MSTSKPNDVDRGITNRGLEGTLPPGVISQAHQRAQKEAPQGWRVKSVDAQAGTKFEHPGESVQYVNIKVKYEEVTYKTHPKTYVEHFVSTVRDLQKEHKYRRPVVSTRVPEIDKRIKKHIDRAKEVLGEMAVEQQLGEGKNKSQNLKKLSKIADQLSADSVLRAQNQTSLSKEETARTLSAAASAQQLRQGEGKQTDDDALKILQDKWQDNVNWYLKRVQKFNHPINQKGLAHAIAKLQELGGEAPYAEAFLEEARIVHQKKLRKYNEELEKSAPETTAYDRLISNRGIK